MRRRKFFTVLVGAGIAWPLVASAQEGLRRVGVLMNASAEDSEGQSYVTAFQQGMHELGWSVGRNLRIDLRWGGDSSERWRRYANELVGLSPDAIVAAGGVLVANLQRASRTVPIVFAQSIDPVGAGIVASLARPGGNATGFAQFEYSLSAKWVELLKDVTPGLKRVGVLREPAHAAGIGQWAIIQAAGSAAGMEVFPLSVRDPGEIERGIAAFAHEPNGGLVIAVGSSTTLHRASIIEAAARHRLVAVYPYRYFATAGGLASYGPDLLGQYRSAASYVDRILKGEKPSDLPVQSPTRYNLTINLKTAKVLGLPVPPTLLARADEVIE